MSNYQEQYDNWIHSQELKGRDSGADVTQPGREGEIRPERTDDKRDDRKVIVQETYNIEVHFKRVDNADN